LRISRPAKAGLDRNDRVQPGIPLRYMPGYFQGVPSALSLLIHQ
jgi:hypothetical protein